ncbi:sensor histidine kinase [Kribbella kalugense]|uniref:sensor histidine kinase n=1 Tax=Kribbella kalugense TaxID=2512221 RepID=UPI001065A85B|nr:ATP-binding protein [Kribbella kalugense]
MSTTTGVSTRAHALAWLSVGRRAIWLDAALAVAGLVSLQVGAANSHTDGWPYAWLWLRMVVVLFPLLIAIRRFEPALALPGLVLGAYLAGLVGQLDWFLLGGCVLALWSLAGRCRVPTVLAVAGFSAALPLLLGLIRPKLISLLYPDIADGSADQGGITVHDFKKIAWNGWPRWQALLIVVLALVFLAIRHRSWADAATARARLTDLRGFLRDPAYERVRDVLLAVAASGLILTEIGQDLFEGNWWSAPRWMPYVVAYAALILMFRRLSIVAVLILAAASLIANWQASTDIVTLYCAFGLALYRLIVTPKRSRSLRWTLPTAIAVLAVLPIITIWMPYSAMAVLFPAIRRVGFHFDFDGVLRNPWYSAIMTHRWPVSLSLVLLLPVCAGIAVRLYWRNREAARREVELEQEAVEREAEQVVLTERSNIARDLHDVVAHAVNLMVIQAETGPDLVRRGETDVLAGFQRIGDAGRRALGELDRLLSALRDADGVPDPQLAPQPGLKDVRQLVTDVSSEQLPIELELTGDPALPPAGHQLTAYRLVQEGLTNAVRHSKATKVNVTVAIGAAGIEVKVVDDGAGFDQVAARRGGRHGLAGMRERVRVHHGTLDIGTAPGNGTTIKAWIPVGVAE